jgi:DNA helicase-2/ATP-dependent DNA helicase PcrA
MSRVLEDTLVRREIAYQVIGGTKFYERAEIKDAIAYLSLLANPFDVVSFTRVANSPRRGIGQTSLARVIGHAQSLDVSVWEVAAEPERVPGLAAAAVKALRRFMDSMAELRELAPTASVAELIEALLSRSGYVEALEAERTIESQGRLENLEQLVEVGREFDAQAPLRADEREGTLEAFLQEIALVADADQRSDDAGLVTLMTLHNAKGLEYPIVFIAGLEDGVFPHSRSVEEGTLEEERRLFYVGVTRAMRALYLTHARRRALFGAHSYGLRSRFLDEIPAELLEVHSERLLRPGAVAPWHSSASFSDGLGSAAAGARGRGRFARERAGTNAGRAGAGGGGQWPEGEDGAEADAAAARFRLGEDIVHAAFGDGVVIGVEPGGVIVVRFAGDGSERKLMAEYAPLSRR